MKETYTNCRTKLKRGNREFPICLTESSKAVTWIRDNLRISMKASTKLKSKRKTWPPSIKTTYLLWLSRSPNWQLQMKRKILSSKNYMRSYTIQRKSLKKTLNKWTKGWRMREKVMRTKNKEIERKEKGWCKTWLQLRETSRMLSEGWSGKKKKKKERKTSWNF